MSIRPEDATVTFVGNTSVSCPGCSSVVVPLKSKVGELDASLGDPRNATVIFINRTTGVSIGSAAAGADGIATFNWTVNLSAASQSLKIGFQVGNYYLRNNVADDVTIVVSK